jgi:bifunctional non-homologous end joining protein LigD
MVVGGWSPQKGSSQTLGALHVGYYDEANRLRYAGGVGTGFDNATRQRLLIALRALEQTQRPFDPADAVPRGVRFVRPAMVVEVEYRRWPEEGLLQQASFKGVRQDKRAMDVTKESPGDHTM